MNKWLILDRDGVINFDSDSFIKSPDEWRAIPGSLEAIARCNRAGYRVVVVSNQSGLARGLFDQATLDAIHDKLQSELAAAGGQLEQIYFCPHGPDDQCDCRKPLPGLFEQFALDHELSLAGIYAVGDSLRDLQAALAAEASPILVRTGKGPRSLAALAALEDHDPLRQVPVYDDLAAFCDWLLDKEATT